MAREIGTELVQRYVRSRLLHAALGLILGGIASSYLSYSNSQNQLSPDYQPTPTETPRPTQTPVPTPTPIRFLRQAYLSNPSLVQER